MNEINVFIHSTYPCLLFLNGDFVEELQENNEIQVKLDLDKKNIFQVHPKNTKDLIYFIPYCFKFDPTDKTLDTTYLLDKYYNLCLHPKLEVRQTTIKNKVYDVRHQAVHIDVCHWGPLQITLSDANKTIQFTPKHIFTKPLCKIHSHNNEDYFILTALTSQQKQYLFICNLADISQGIQKVCDDILFDLPKIVTKTNTNDNFNHVIIQELELGTQGLTCVQKYSSIEGSYDLLEISHQNVAQCFFECIKVNDFIRARTFLTKKLDDLLSDQHLKAFFPKFNQVLISKTRENVAILLADNTYYFNVEIIQNKIDNIEMLENV